jgi:hypothetical protein
MEPNITPRDAKQRMPRMKAATAKPGETEDGDPPCVGATQPLDALHRSGLSRPTEAQQSENLSLRDVEGDVVDGHERAVQLAEMLD